MLHNQCLFVSTKMIRFFPYNKTSNMCVFLHAWLIKIVEFKIFVTPLLLLFMIHPLYLNLTNWFFADFVFSTTKSSIAHQLLHIQYHTYKSQNICTLYFEPMTNFRKCTNRMFLIDVFCNSNNKIPNSI